MLRRILQVAAVLLLLMLLLFGALAMVLPGYVETEEFQAGLRARASKALGTEVSWDHVEVGVLPPRVILDSLVLAEGEAGETAVDPPARLRADAVDLRFSLWPLLSRRLEMGSLVIRGVDLVVTRTDEGWVLPLRTEASAAAGDATESAEPAEAEPGAESAAGGALALTLGRVQLVDAEIQVRDRVGDRESDWQFSNLDLDLIETSDSGRYALDFAGDLAAGATAMGPVTGDGALRVEGVGSETMDLGFEVQVELDGAAIEPLVPYLPVASGRGRLSGRLDLVAESAAMQEIRADLRAEDLVTRVAGVDVDGKMTLQGVQRAGAPSDFKIVLDFASGGRAKIEGTRAPDAALAGTSRLDGVDLVAFANLLGDAREAKGAMTGDVSFSIKGGGGIAGLSTDLTIGSLEYKDATHRLSQGGLDLALVFDESRSGQAPGPSAGRIKLKGGFEGAMELPSAGARGLDGRLDAKLDLMQADVSALPFDIAFAALPAGWLTGEIDLRGKLRSRFSEGSNPSRAEPAGRKPLLLDGKLRLDASTGQTGPFDLNAVWENAQGGSFSAKGTSSRAAELDLAIGVDALDLGLLAPFLSESGIRAAGRLSGPGRIVGPASEPSQIDLDAKILAGELAFGEYEVSGPFGIKLAVKRPLSSARAGTADLDLTNARVRYEGRFEKKAGIPAQLDTQFKPNAAGETEFDSRLQLKNLDRIQIQGALGDTTRMTLSAAALDLGQAAEFVPLLSDYAATGQAALSDVAMEREGEGDPRFRGKLTLNDVALSAPEAGRVNLSGAVVGEGNRLRTEALRVVAGDVSIELEGYLEDPFGEGRYAFSGRTVGKPEVNSLLSALTSKGGTLFGPLQLEGDISGSLPETKSLRETLIGTLRFSIGEDVGGQIKGVSLLRTVLDQFPILGGALLTKPFRGGRSVDEFFSDEFELMSGEFAIQNGQLEAKALRVTYEGYEASLSGLMQLSDLSLDMTGNLLLNSDLVAVLVGAVGGDGTDRDPIEIPLARVSNTLSDPKVSMTARTLAALPRILLQATGIDRIREGIEEGLGKILKPRLPNQPGIDGSP